jgi:transcriptional regulator with XRE-family HTH domain
LTAILSLGNLLRLKRMNLDYSQHDLARLVGWRTIDRLRDIEADLVQLNRETLERMFDVLEFSNEERGMGLYLAGVAPTKEEEDTVIAEFAGEMEAWPAAYIKDFRWHFIHANDEALKFFMLDRENVVLKQRENMLRLLVDPEAGAMYDAVRSSKAWEEFRRLEIANFKEANRNRENQPWLVQEVKALKAYPDFSRIWNELDDATITRYANLRRMTNLESMPPPPWQGSNAGAAAGYQILALPMRSDQRFRLRVVVEAPSQRPDTLVLQAAGAQGLTALAQT